MATATMLVIKECVVADDVIVVFGCGTTILAKMAKLVGSRDWT